MTAINDLVAAAAGIRIPFGILYESLPPTAIRMGPLSALGVAQTAGPDSSAEPQFPVEKIYSLIESCAAPSWSVTRGPPAFRIFIRTICLRLLASLACESCLRP